MNHAPIGRQCVRCKQYKHLSDFGPDLRAHDGLARRCLACEKNPPPLNPEAPTSPRSFGVSTFEPVSTDPPGCSECGRELSPRSGRGRPRITCPPPRDCAKRRKIRMDARPDPPRASYGVLRPRSPFHRPRRPRAAAPPNRPRLVRHRPGRAPSLRRNPHGRPPDRGPGEGPPGGRGPGRLFANRGVEELSAASWRRANPRAQGAPLGTGQARPVPGGASSCPPTPRPEPSPGAADGTLPGTRRGLPLFKIIRPLRPGRRRPHAIAL